MNPPPPASRPGLAAHRPLLTGLALLSLLLAWFYQGAISRTDPWYRNANMNIHNLVDALAINSGIAPVRIEQPGFTTKYLLALDYRLRHHAGVLPVWNLKLFAASPEPLEEIRTLVHVGRVHSRVLVLLFILTGAGLAWLVSREFETACLTVVLLCGSSGLLFHGLLTRPELLCGWLGGVLALFCTWRGTSARQAWRNQLWIFLAGLLVGLAALAQLPGIYYLAVCFAWCWLAATLADQVEVAVTGREPASIKSGLLPLVSSLVVLWVLHDLLQSEAPPGTDAAVRLRVAAVIVGILPLLPLATGRHRIWSFLLGRTREFTLLGGGVLAALPLGWLALRAVMPGPQALEYLSGVLTLALDPGPFLKIFSAASPNAGRVFVQFFRDSPFLLLGAATATTSVMLARAIPSRLKAFIALLFVSALGMILLMCRGNFLTPYSLYVQVPLLLLLSLSLGALARCRPDPSAAPDGNWPGPVIITAALVLVLTVYLRLQPKYAIFQDDAGRPVNDMTVTFLYEHSAHPRDYLKAMADHYGNRQHFTEALERYLDDPAHRY